MKDEPLVLHPVVRELEQKAIALYRDKYPDGTPWQDLHGDTRYLWMKHAHGITATPAPDRIVTCPKCGIRRDRLFTSCAVASQTEEVADDRSALAGDSEALPKADICYYVKGVYMLIWSGEEARQMALRHPPAKAVGVTPPAGDATA